MIANQVRDILVPLDEYPTVYEDTTLHDAFAALQASRETGRRYRHILVLNQKEQLVGILGMHDLLHGLFPDYLRVGEHSRFEGATNDVANLARIWGDTLVEQSRAAAKHTVQNVMYPPKDIIGPDDPITLAIYLMVSHRTSMLPVVEHGRVIGTCRIPDVFQETCGVIFHD